MKTAWHSVPWRLSFLDRRALARFALLWVLAFAGASARGDDAVTLACRLRQPAAMAASRDGRWLYVANGRSGSLSVIDTSTLRVAAELDLGRSLADVAVLDDDRHLLAVDRGGNALVLVEARQGKVRVESRIAVADDPVRVIMRSPEAGCVVASTWSRRLTFVGLERPGGSASLAVRGTIELPFSPREMALAPGGAMLFVADAFGGKLAVVDCKGMTLGPVRTLPAHGIRGLAVTADGRELAVAHQILRRSMKTDFEDVHWGRLLTSHVRVLRMDAVLTPGSDADLLRDGSVTDLGEPYDGAADPTCLVRAGSGALAVGLGGVGQVALGRASTGYFHRSAVGGRPTALAFDPAEKTLYVADASTDTIAAIAIAAGRRLATVSLGPRPEPTLADRGEALFHDARLSLDGWMSCHSCHTDGHTNGQLGDTLGDGSFGAPKRVPSLLGAGVTGPWAWTGTMASLEDQVRKSVDRTMRGRPLEPGQLSALTAYLVSLEPPRPAPATDAAASERGRALFKTLECAGCHTPPTYTSPKRYDVNLADEAGNRRFNPPSLRGVSRREPLLHDGRAATLEDVFLKHGHPHQDELSKEQVADLVAFLRTL